MKGRFSLTFTEKFEAIKKKFTNADLSHLTENFAVQINLTDDEYGGSFYIAYTNGTLDVEPYDYHDRSAMVTAAAKTFEDFLDGKKQVGDLMIEGNSEHVKMIGLAAKKKPTPKKSTAKKTTAKKSAAKK